MIKVTNSSPLHGVQRSNKKKRTGDGDSGLFSQMMDDTQDSSSTSASTTTASAAPASNLGMIMAAQSVDDESQARKQHVQEAHSVLNDLEKLRYALLTGDVPISLLRNIEHRMARLRTMSNDPMLHEISEDIELRAAVELAKLQWHDDH